MNFYLKEGHVDNKTEEPPCYRKDSFFTCPPQQTFSQKNSLIASDKIFHAKETNSYLLSKAVRFALKALQITLKMKVLSDCFFRSLCNLTLLHFVLHKKMCFLCEVRFFTLVEMYCNNLPHKILFPIDLKIFTPSL